MKITGGIYKGKNIDARVERNVRPTSGRIRETIFNILQHGKFLKHPDFIGDPSESVIEDKRIIDTFCGTGALSLEALSRGAAHAVLIDQNQDTLQIARRNTHHLGVESQVTFIRSDSTRLPPSSAPCDLAFVDPPYNNALVNKGLKSLMLGKWLSPGAIIVVEMGKKETLDLPKEYVALDDRIHDKTRIVILQYQPD